MKRKQRMNEVQKRLGKRKLLWLGFRGADARVLLQIPQFSRVFSITTPLEASPMVSEVCLETIQKRRVDLHTYDPDRDNSPSARKLHRLLFAALGEPVVALTYRPDKFFATAYFPRAEFVEYLGLFRERQAAFEHKPWVESELRKYGVRTIRWDYYGKYNLHKFTHLLSKGPIVARLPISSTGGGRDPMLFREPHELTISSTLPYDALFSVTRYLEPNIPLNVNACVFQDGTVSLHGPSLQLIGIRECTGYPLGYCGNDFAYIRNLDINILDKLEAVTMRAGKWLAGMGYLEAFGIDAIAYHDHVYLSEIKPRFQNSSVIAAKLDEELDRPDMYLNHMASFFGMPSPSYVPLRELAKEQAQVSQIICYNRRRQAVLREDTAILKYDNIDFTLLPAPDVEVSPEGMLFRAVVKDNVTANGHAILKRYKSQIQDVIRLYSLINRNGTVS